MVLIALTRCLCLLMVSSNTPINHTDWFLLEAKVKDEIRILSSARKNLSGPEKIKRGLS